MRKQGYYWVKCDGEWHVAMYRTNDKAWTLSTWIDDSWWLYDSDFEIIDEEMLTPQINEITSMKLTEVSITASGPAIGFQIIPPSSTDPETIEQ